MCKSRQQQNAKYWIVETERQKWKYYEEQKQTHPNKQIRNPTPKTEGLIEIWVSFFPSSITIYSIHFILFLVWNFIHFTCVFLVRIHSYRFIQFYIWLRYIFVSIVLRIPFCCVQIRLGWSLFGIPSLLACCLSLFLSFSLSVSHFTRFLVIKCWQFFFCVKNARHVVEWQSNFFRLAHNVYHDDSQANSFHFHHQFGNFTFFTTIEIARSSIFG